VASRLSNAILLALAGKTPNGDQAINSIMLTSVPGNAEADWVT